MNSIKLSLLVFYLTVFISSSDSNLEGNPQNLFHFNIEQVFSVLYERENNQEIMFLVPNFFIKPSNLKEIILKKEGIISFKFKMRYQNRYIHIFLY